MKTGTSRQKKPPISKGDIKVIKAVDRHVQEHIGEIACVLDEKRSPHVHIDIHVVAPTKERNYFTLVTSGMSEKPMPVPEGTEDGTYAELMICLPPEWPMSHQSWSEEANWWPLRLLKETARYPFEANTWLYAGHSLTNGKPASAYASNTSMISVLLLRPVLLRPEAHIIHINHDRHALLWALFPLYKEELEFKLRRGSDALEERFAEYGITELLHPKRVNVADV